ncbi:unnamed protein product [Rotaria magnacalcarata]|uniref:Tc1-like transposase DDE domain-containing protein n=3 Tax=Rotaria magnacalcarata TaxID=392030 RepID=A0A819MRA8_9BILA|nr:unnamed protein product [Rotaria magnacalcarata]CAF2083817.1 unnamed protein product [Rotaria magnacalcarata]CAF2135287.1 unnamed protein product [Rotaria magnacalcarata]CAF3984397.1 unnamed protein product [Rotaria magnacalcarata]CAF4270232.1 unnamed protein product [Rotaria magnacalcarata]
MSSHPLKQIDLRQRIYDLLGQMNKCEVVKYLQKEGIARSTIYSIIKRCENGISIQEKPGKGRPPTLNQKKQLKLRNLVENRIGVSRRQLARKFLVSRYCIMRNIKKLGLKYYKRQKTPKYNQKQLDQMTWGCRKLRRNFIDSKKFIVMDDEKYFTLSGDNMPGNAGFIPQIQQTLHGIKGISVPYIGTTHGPAIDSNLYVQQCLPKLLAFIRRYHADNNYIFWPDLASSHYAKTTITWLNQQNIHFVPKQVNPPNLPKARPIEDFWSILADKVYHGGWLATTEQQLINRIKQQLKKVDLKIVQTMMLEVRKKLRKIEQKGPLSIL